MKKNVFLWLVSTWLLMQPCVSVALENYNIYDARYRISLDAGGLNTFISISSGHIGPNGWYRFKRSSLNAPDYVFVHVFGKSSLFGAGGLTRVRNVDDCIVRIYDAGLLQGVKLTYTPACGVGG